MNLLFPQAHRTNPALPEEPTAWPIVLKDVIKEKYMNHSSASSRKSSTSTMADNASTHSSVSAATTLKGSVDLTKKKKWYSLSSKSTETLSPEKQAIQNQKEAARKAVHNEAMASYFSTR